MMVPLPSKSAEVFAGLSRTPDNPWVFRGRKKGTRPINLNDSWDRVCKRTGLDGVLLHDLRRPIRVPRPRVGREPTDDRRSARLSDGTTARYAHLARDSSAKVEVGTKQRPPLTDHPLPPGEGSTTGTAQRALALEPSRFRYAYRTDHAGRRGDVSRSIEHRMETITSIAPPRGDAPVSSRTSRAATCGTPSPLRIRTSLSLD